MIWNFAVQLRRIGCNPKQKLKRGFEDVLFIKGRMLMLPLTM